MRKGPLFAVLVVAVFLFSGGSGLAQAAKLPPKGQPIRIGGSLPLAGIYSETGKLIKAGYEFWVDDVNSRGGLLGRPVKMTIYDDEGNAEKAVANYERAITVDKVDLVFGGYPATSNVAVMPLMEKYRKVFVGMGGQMKSFEQGYTYSFASPPLLTDWVYLPLEGILNDLVPRAQWPKSMAIIGMNNVIGLSGKEDFIKWAEKNGIKVVVSEKYDLPLNDATPLVSKAKNSGAELLVCLSFFDDAVMITRSAKSMNYNPKMYFQLFAPTIPAWKKEMGQDGNGVIAAVGWPSKLPFPGNDRINAGARERLKTPAAPMYFGDAYCWMRTLELGVEGAHSLDSTKIRDYLKSHKFNLPYGMGITFDKRGLPPPFSYGTETVNGQVELVWPRTVATSKLLYPRPDWRK